MFSKNIERAGCRWVRSLARILLLSFFANASFLFDAPLVDAQDQLRNAIDSHFAADLPSPSLANDAEFARRVSIDLMGMPLSSDRMREFIADKAGDKREKLVSELISTPQFERRLTTFLDVTLMERRAYKDIKEDAWIQYLLESVRENKPWNVLAREILSADGIDDSKRAAVRFALARDAEPNLLTRDIGRVFFGRDLQCAQCHDHPLVEDYLQSDYQGLLAFVAPGFVKTIQKPGPKQKNGKPGKPIATKIYAEKDGNDINFESVFVKETKHRTGPRLIGMKSVLEPDLMPVSATNLNRPPQSRRDTMAASATEGVSRAFNENMANRLWAMMMGRGLVHPPDFHHRDNPPVKPELMKVLGERFAAMQFDMRSFLKEIALSKVYQRAYELPEFDSSIKGIESALQAAKDRKAKLDVEVEKAHQVYEEARKHWSVAEGKLIPVALEVEKQRKALVSSDAGTAKLKSTYDAANAASVRDESIKKAIADSLGQIKFAAEKLRDSEFAQLIQQIDSKLKKVAASAQSTAKKKLDADKKLKANLQKVESARKDLNSGYAKRKPLRVDFDTKESVVRAKRDELERLISLRGAVESRISTLEKILKYDRLKKEISAAAKEPNGESASDLRSSLNRLENSLVVRLSRNHTVSALRPLSPEQLCWSTLGVTGFYQRYLASEEAKLRKEQKLDKEAKLNLAQLRTVEERTFKILKGHLNNFIRFYSAGAGQPQGDFFATADQALFAANSGSINSYVNPSGNNVTDRMLKARETRLAAEELYLSILSRMPSSNEIKEVDLYLKSKGEKNKRQAVMELAWSLINSAEFRFNH